MSFAIIAAILALVISVLVVIFVFKFIRSKGGKSIQVKTKVKSLESVGVSSSLAKEKTIRAGTVDKSNAAAKKPSTVPADAQRDRFRALEILAALIFGTLGVKIWSMQVLSQSEFSQASEENRYTKIMTAAPRGCIYDKNNTELVANRNSTTVYADSSVSSNRDVLLRLSSVLGIPYYVVRERSLDTTLGAQNTRIIASDVKMRDVAFICEHSDAFPGVSVESRSVRDYPYGALGAHVVGYTGPITEDELEQQQEGRDLELGDDVGKSGLEIQYDSLLAGEHGERKVMVDSLGNIVEVVSETQPTRGSDLYLTIDASIQYACDKALADVIAPDGTAGSGKGTAGAVVAMDVNTGAIIALASFPTYEPAKFVGGISQEIWDLYNTDESRYPLVDRAISGSYPAASTYKAFTGMAGLEYHYANKDSTWICGGSWDGWNSGTVQKCWQTSGHGELNFYQGIVNSCDIVFYEIAKAFYDNRATIGDTAMQDVIKKFGFGELTGVDLPGETAGRVPTPEWKAEYFKDFPEEAQWVGGDLTNMSIGQGYVLTTPLQLAVGYGGVATGKLMKPHVLHEVKNASGDVVKRIEPQVLKELDVDGNDLQEVRKALRGVITDNSAIAKIYDGYGIEAAGKTGTAEIAGKQDTAWFVTYAPYDNPRYVVSVVVEEGGGGSDTATPIGASILNVLLNTDEQEIGSIKGSNGKSIAQEGTSSGRTD